MKHIVIAIITIAVSLIAQSQVTIIKGNRVTKSDFEKQIEQYTNKIDSTIVSEKSKMKKEIDAVNTSLKNQTITEDQANQQKQEIATKFATLIDDKTQSLNNELQAIVQKRVELSVKNTNLIISDSAKSVNNGSYTINPRYSLNTRFAMSKVGLANGFSLGNNDFSFDESGSTELTFLVNYKIGKTITNNPWSLNFGLGLIWNTLWVKDNTKYIDEDVNGNLQFSTFHTDLKKSKIRGTYLTAPLEIRYDFMRNKVNTKDGSTYQTDGFSITAGTYFGYRIISKRILIYDEGGKVKDKTRGDFNQAPVIYGLTLGVSWKELGIFVRKDLNEYFSNYNSDYNQRIEFGLRLGF